MSAATGWLRSAPVCPHTHLSIASHDLPRTRQRGSQGKHTVGTTQPSSSSCFAATDNAVRSMGWDTWTSTLDWLDPLPCNQRLRLVQSMQGRHQTRVLHRPTRSRIHQGSLRSTVKNIIAGQLCGAVRHHVVGQSLGHDCRQQAQAQDDYADGDHPFGSSWTHHQRLRHPVLERKTPLPPMHVGLLP